MAKRGNVTPWGLLDAARQGDAQASALWHEWESATKGRRAMEWSRRHRRNGIVCLGLRELLLGDEDERTDEDIAADTDGQGELVAMLTPAAWRMVRRSGTAAEDLLEVCEAAHPELRLDAMQAYLNARGVPVRLLWPDTGWGRAGPRDEP
jgi:hypothetical protein